MSERHYYPPGPVAAAFLASPAFVRGLMGPIGSGKSVACAMELMTRAAEQAPGRDGMRRSRWVIIRNTYPELKSTTIKTWLDWFPEAEFGKFSGDFPLTHHVRFDDVAAEFIFLALDREQHVKKLLSLEVTGGWINEARELPKAILDGLTGRVGRFPAAKDRPPQIARQDWPTWSGVIMDTNPPDDDHWWHGLAEHSDEELVASIAVAETEMRAGGVLQPDQPLFAFFRQPSGLAAQAENLENLPPGYYARAAAGKRFDWIKVYVRAEYGSVQDGKPVYPEYADQLHGARAPLPALRGVPLAIGWDFGLTPAAVITQLSPRGQIRVLRELVAERMGIRQFARDVVKPLLASEFADWALGDAASFAAAEPWRRILNYADPAGLQGAQTDAGSCFEELRAQGFEVEPARSNDTAVRVGCVAGHLIRLVDGQPGLLLDPRCRLLRKGFNGLYRYRRLAVAGEARFQDYPDKNQASHPHDALQYVCLGLTEPVAPPAPPTKPSWRETLQPQRQRSGMRA